MDPDISVDDFIAEARVWLDENAEKRTHRGGDFVWGEGEFDVAVFHNMTHDDEATYIAGISDWIKRKAERGYHAITRPPSVGGLGLSRAHQRAYGRLEREYVSPGRHELIGVTAGLIASTVEAMGSEALNERFLADLLRTDILACQLFSEPGAGSDLAGLVVPGRARWRRVGDQRSEGVELGRPVQPVGRADRAHRSRRGQAQGPHRVHDADGPPRCRSASDPPDEWRVVVLRGVLHRRPDPR